MTSQICDKNLVKVLHINNITFFFLGLLWRQHLLPTLPFLFHLFLYCLNPLSDIINAAEFFRHGHVMWALATLLLMFAPFLAHFAIFSVKKLKSCVGTEKHDCKFMPLLCYLPFFHIFRHNFILPSLLNHFYTNEGKMCLLVYHKIYRHKNLKSLKSS